MKFTYCKHLIKCDLLAINNVGILKNLFFNESFSFTFWFRLGTWLESGNHSFLHCVFTFFIKEKCVKQEDRFLWEPRLEEA